MSEKRTFHQLHRPLILVMAIALSCQQVDHSPSHRSIRPTPRSEAKTIQTEWFDEPPLPEPLTNNAVASLMMDGTLYLFSFLGLDATKAPAGITRRAFAFDTWARRWAPIRPVPGRLGRIAATAQGVDGRVYIFGGYTVAPNGREVSVPHMDIYDPRTDQYDAGAPIPIPVDDSVSGVWRDRFIYLISGWSQKDNVANVQIYDTRTNRWQQATPIPGPSVFGHAGGIVGDTIVYCDGVRIDPARRPRFVISEACYRGKIDPRDPSHITWSSLPAHPGEPKYRMAAGVIPEEGLILFAGGTTRPYNYDGIGYDGIPSEPSSQSFAYDVRQERWLVLPDMPSPTMDHRGLVGAGRSLYLIGGMREQQRVTSGVRRLTVHPDRLEER